MDENDGVDRISDLPDSILCKILSCVPTKYAVATSILSKRWKNLDTFGYVPIKLDLDDHNFSPTSFVDFVDRLLDITLRDVPCVDTIILNCNKNYGDEIITSWFTSALRLNVHDLELKLYINWPRNLFQHLNSCKSLVRLVFMRKIISCEKFVLRLPNHFSLPNLKVLTIWNANFYDETQVGSINELIAGCPVLEDLCFSGCEFKYVKFLCIESHVLKNLTIEDCWTDSPGILEIDAPRLKTLIYRNCVASNYHIRNFKSLNMACIQVSSRENGMYDNAVTELVTACSSTAHLYLAGCSISAICWSSVTLPTFQNLSWLELGCLGIDGWTHLACLLSSAPYLQRLTLEEGFKEYIGGYEKFESFVPSTPSCLELHLKEIDYWAFKEVEDEIKLIEYFLKNGRVLQKLKLHCSLLYQDLSILRGLLVLPSNKNFLWTEIENGVQISLLGINTTYNTALELHKC